MSDSACESIPVTRHNLSARDSIKLRSERFDVVLGFGPFHHPGPLPAEVDCQPVYIVSVPPKLSNAADSDRQVRASELWALVRDIRQAGERDGIRCIVRLPDGTFVDVDGDRHTLTKRDAKKYHFPGALGHARPSLAGRATLPEPRRVESGREIRCRGRNAVLP